jgi:hypothetical protein
VKPLPAPEPFYLRHEKGYAIANEMASKTADRGAAGRAALASAPLTDRRHKKKAAHRRRKTMRGRGVAQVRGSSNRRLPARQDQGGMRTEGETHLRDITLQVCSARDQAKLLAVS